MREANGRWGVLVTRGQPFHKGHIEVIKQALKENDKVLVVIGSADKCDSSRNPLSIESRIILFSKLRDYLADEAKNRLYYIPLEDWSSDKDIPYESSDGRSDISFDNVNSDWGLYLYYNIVTFTRAREFTLYYNDSLEILESWFPKFVRDRITVRNSERIGNYSSSRVRFALINEDVNYLKDSLPYLHYPLAMAVRDELLGGEELCATPFIALNEKGGDYYE